MAISTYSELLASIGIWLDGSDLQGQQPVLVALAEAEISARLAAGLEAGRVITPMMARDDVMIDGEYAGLPDGGGAMILPISFEVTGLPRAWRLRYVSPDNLVGMKIDRDAVRAGVNAMSGAPAPRYWTIVGDRFRFFPTPAEGAAFTAEFTRYVEPPPLGDANPANWVLTRHPNAYLYGTLAQAELMGWNDERVGNLAALFANACDGILARYPAPVNQTPLASALPAFGRGRGGYLDGAGA